jgi:hypothetical protein
MTQVLVRYRLKPNRIDENTRFVEGLFAELRAKAPQDVRYLALQVEDGTVVHLAFFDEGATPISGLDAFTAYHARLAERCAEPPNPGDVTIVGNYRMLPEERASTNDETSETRSSKSMTATPAG